MRVLLLNQCFYPDHVSTAQHLRDLAEGLTARGHEVSVICSERAYDQPDKRFPRDEIWQGIQIRRVPVLGLGKRSIWRRIADSLTFWVNAALEVFMAEKPDVIISLTSPPMISCLGAAAAKWHGCRSVIWLMDMNPDQAIVNGVLRKGSLIEKLLSGLMNWSYRQASLIVALDRFMQQRLRGKGVTEDAIQICIPWSHDDHLDWDPAGRAAFRKEHGIEDRFVVMYSGNHSPCHPLDAVLQAALQLRQHRKLAFLFVGGGTEQQKVREFAQIHQLDSIRCLPYQPIEKLSGSLSAADLHLVVMGDPYVGIVHPCKIYNIVSLGLPFLFIGPNPSHGSDLVAEIGQPEIARFAPNGDVEAVIRHILEAMKKGSSNSHVSIKKHSHHFSINQLLPLICGRLEELETDIHVAA